MNFKNILIINYAFPPYPGTGGRRWSKFAKYLAQRGHNVFVIGSKNTSKKYSGWITSEELKNLNVKYITSYYPQTENRLSSKIYHFLYSFPIKVFSVRNFLDRSFYWGKIVKRYTDTLLKKNDIRNIVLTVPPFGYVEDAIELKKKYPHVNFILDIRDDIRYYLKGLEEKRMQREYNKHREFLSSFDFIITVSDHMTKNYKELVPFENKKNVYTIHNGYDPDDFITQLLPADIKKKEKIKFVYAGNLIEECFPYVKAFFSALLFLKNEKIDIYKKIEVVIFGNKEQNAFSFCKENGIDCVNFFGYSPKEIVINHLYTADFCLIFPADFYSDYSLETKFFEYCFLRKPIIVYPETGLCSEIVKKNNIGFAISPNNSHQEITRIIERYLNNEFEYNNKFDISEYNISNLTRKLEKLLK